jgi:hypothetical protein
MSAMDIDRVLEVLERELAILRRMKARSEQRRRPPIDLLWRNTLSFGVSSGPMMLFLGAGNDLIARPRLPLQHKRQNDHQPLLR